MPSFKSLLATVLLASAAFAAPIADASPITHVDESEMTPELEARGILIRCDSGVRMYTVRGSDADPKNNDILSFGENFVKTIASSIAKNIPYAATFSNYETSEAGGVKSLTFRIQRYHKHCPSSKVAIFGYSQGAQVVADTLIGPPGTRGQGLAPEYRNNIVAVVQFADPSFVPGLSFDRGTAHSGGMVGRDNADQYTSYGYADKMLSYCDDDDMYCANGNSGYVHTQYMSKYQGDIWAFFASKA